MALVKNSDLQVIDRTLKAGFLDAYNGKNYEPRWPMIAARHTSTSRENIYPSVIDAAQVREWSEGERVKNGLVLESARVTNQKWELTYALKREDIDDDASGVVAMALSRIRSGTMKFKRHMDKLVFNVVKNNGTCLDGLALFHASHPVNPRDSAAGTFSNTDSGALTANNYDAARVAMMELKGPDGDPINENPNVLLVSPAKESTARKILEADEIIYSATASDTREFNVFRGRGIVVVVPHLGTAHGGNDAYWHVVDATDTEDRALIAQIREEVEFVSLTNLTDPNVFNLDEYVWGMRARHTAAGGNPKKIFRRTG
ncbi:MAG: Mu-like prophage major head subunit gpT family protein [Polyangiales bacterium]